jgi:hypothetical protein
MKPIICCLFIILLTNVALPANSSHLDVKRKLRPYTRNLPRIDKVELETYNLMETRIESTAATKIVEGREAQAIASLWRTQNYRSFTPMCHFPAFGIKFYSKGKLIVYASLCWECNNIVIREPKLGVAQGFDGESKKGKQLLEVLIRAFKQ